MGKKLYLSLLLAMFSLGLILFFYSMFGFITKTKDTEVFGSKTEAKNYEIVLNDKGYVPRYLTIKVGSTVTFRTTRNKAHWPASNLHPQHDIYPEFDPGEAVPADKTWSFTFGRVGEWGFHDHIRSYYNGIVTVIE